MSRILGDGRTRGLVSSGGSGQVSPESPWEIPLDSSIDFAGQPQRVVNELCDVEVLGWRVVKWWNLQNYLTVVCDPRAQREPVCYAKGISSLSANEFIKVFKRVAKCARIGLAFFILLQQLCHSGNFMATHHATASLERVGRKNCEADIDREFWGCGEQSIFLKT